MTKHRTFAALDPFPSDWPDSLAEFVSTLAANFQVVIGSDPTTLKVVAGPDNGQVAIGVNGHWRYISATITAASPGGGSSRTLDVWVTGTANVFTPGSPGEVDSTDYSFALAIVEHGASPAGAALSRLVATAQWNGSLFTRVDQLVAAVPLHAHNHAAGNADQLTPANIGAATETDLLAEVARAEAAEALKASASALTAEIARAVAAEAARATLDGGGHVPLSQLAGITSSQLSGAAGITGSQLAAAAGIANAQLAAGITLRVVVRTSNYAAANGELVVVTGGTPLIINLPAPVNNGVCGVFCASGSSGATVTVQSNGAAPVIYGVGAILTPQFALGTLGAYTLFRSDGTNWYITSGQPDTGWVPISLPASWATYSPGAGIAYVPAARLLGDRVWFRGAAQNNTGGSTSFASSVPSTAMRPAANVWLPTAPSLATGFPQGLSVFTDGTLHGMLGGIGAGDAVYFDGLSYPVS